MTNKNNTGNRNAGNRNTGKCNTGICNAGSLNTGDRNTGSRNTGSRNTGSRNTGYCNTGSRNTGYCNTGDCNTGDCNTGDCNTGNWNTGHCNTGYFNTIEPEFILVFNKECKKSDFYNSDKPEFIYSLILTNWIEWKDMTNEEKINNPNNEHLGGFLRKFSYKEAWRNAWNKASLEDRKKVYNIPNFDNEIFKEITGIDVDKELTNDEIISINGKKYKLIED